MLKSLKNVSMWVLLALILIAVSIPVAFVASPLTALYPVSLAVFCMQVGAREE